jgi:hypothetical protein
VNLLVNKGAASSIEITSNEPVINVEVVAAKTNE